MDNCSLMARCMDKCRNGLVLPCSTEKSWLAASGFSRSAWYSGCSSIRSTAMVSKGVRTLAERCLLHASVKNCRTCSREGLNIKYPVVKPLCLAHHFTRLYRHVPCRRLGRRSEEHTSELQSLMRISYAVFCLKKNKTKKTQ